MPDWKQLVENHLANLPIAPSRHVSIAEELAQHLEDRYEEMLSSGSGEADALNAVMAELEHTDRLPAALPPQLRAPKRPPVSEGVPTSGHLLADFARDLRYALRSMRKTPVFSFFAVLTLALGLGANTTVFTIINTLLLHPLPVTDPSRLVSLYSTEDQGARQSGHHLPLSYPDFEDYEKQQSAFSSMAAYTPALVMTLQGNSGSQRVFGELVTKSYFKTLGIHPAAGRFFLPGEDSVPGSAPVAVLSYAAWKGRFGGAPDIIGRTLEINNTALTVVGIAPKGFLGVSALFGPDLWLPATMFQRLYPTDYGLPLTDRAKLLFHAVARLKPGHTPNEAQANLRTIAAALQREFPQSDESRTIAIRPITEELYSGVGDSSGIVFGSFVLLVIVALVLAIACSNVANLLLARAASRRHETAVRLAIGASRARLIRQALTESLLLSILSCFAGLAVGYAGCSFVWSFCPPEVAQNMVAPKLDGTVFAFALFVSLATAFLFGLAPALRSSRTDVVGALKEETPTTGRGRRTVTFANGLLVAQVAFSLVALITAALFLRSIQKAYRIDPGFQTARLATFMMNPAQAGYGESRLKQFYRTVHDRVSALPDIASVSWSDRMPFWNTPSHSVSVVGSQPLRKSQLTMTVVNTVDLDYFETMAIPLVSGRVFIDADLDGTLPVAIINEDLAKKYWPGGSALGHRLHLSGKSATWEVVGVVKTANYTALGEKPQPCIYLPLQQNFAAGMTLYVQSKSDPASVLAEVPRELRTIDPNIQVTDVRTGAKILNQVLFAPRIAVSLLGVFGSLALTLASIGLYGVMAYSVNRRRKEIGLRMALGATRWSVLGLILREGMTVVCAGIVIGLAASLLLGRILAGMLFGIGSADPISLAAACLALLLVALLACYFPARAATRIDPMLALRDS